MQLRLTYDGPLLSTGNKGDPDHVHSVRKRFHKQLGHLWVTHPYLRNIKARNPPLDRPRFEELADQWPMGDYKFCPIVRDNLGLQCAIDVLFLRSSVPGDVLKQGDIDGRLKALFDALAMPRCVEQLGKNVTPQADENPFFCLLQDDRLVTQVTVETDLLLEGTGSSCDLSRNAARLVVTAKLWPYTNLGEAILGPMI